MSRAYNEIRPVSIQRKFPTRAPGSVLISQGETRILCTAAISKELPGWMRNLDKGWVTAEYNMLPASTEYRKPRKTDGRSQEIQRLIGRALRTAVDLRKMPGLLITCDCDVLSADGGTRTASVTGACVALIDALAEARRQGLLAEDPLLERVAAVSVGLVGGQAFLDLDYDLDYRAEADINIVMNSAGRFVEIQGTGEESDFSREDLNTLFDLAEKGIQELLQAQERALADDS